MEWVKIEDGCPLPPERRYVLVMMEPDDYQTNGAVSVGWLRVLSGGPEFIVPSYGPDATRLRTHYCDCLGDDFAPPGWAKQRPAKRHLNAEISR